MLPVTRGQLEQRKGLEEGGEKVANLVYPSYLVGRGWEFNEAPRFFLNDEESLILS